MPDHLVGGSGDLEHGIRELPAGLKPVPQR
jgi:hypothetical protein